MLKSVVRSKLRTTRSADKPEVGVNAITNVSGANDTEPDARM